MENNSVRRKKIVEIVSELENVDINYLVKNFNISKSTIYRDISIIEDKGLIRKTKNGIASIDELLIDKESLMDVGLKVKTKEKKAIVKKAMEFVNSNEAIIIDSGTTNFLLAKEIKKSNLRNLTIITNNIITQVLLSRNNNLRIVSIGGMIIDGFHSSLGDFLYNILQEVTIKKVFITTKGVSLTGNISEFEYSESIIKKLFIEKGEKKILLIDSGKFSKFGMYKVINLNTFDLIITDSNIEKEQLDILKKGKYQLEVVEVE